MRIISGRFRSRRLKTPGTDQKVRPTTDRARETLFNILSNRIDFEKTECLDLFCGTGSLGLESISRGAFKCTFVDKDVKLAAENISVLGVSGVCKVVKSDVIKFLKIEKNLSAGLIFCDPPYNFKNYNELLSYLKRSEALVVIEHDINFVPDSNYETDLVVKKKIGITNLSIFDFSRKHSTIGEE